MGEERGFSRSSKSFGNRANKGRRFERRDGSHNHAFKKDGERRFNRDDHRRDRFRHDDGERRDGFKGGFERKRHFDSDKRHSGFKKDGERRFERRDAGDNPRYQKFDGERRFNRDDHRRDRFRHDDGERRDGFKGGFERKRHFDSDKRHSGFKKDGERRFERRDAGDNPRYQKFDGERRDGSHNHAFKKDGERHFNRDDRPRRNSDGTMSFPSQNPYTHRRPNEPRMPKGMEWSMLSKDERERLRGLAKEHAENIGLHILAAYALQDEDPQLALQHAQWVAKQASRIDFARETLAFTAYRCGDYKLAAREFRTAMRMNGYLDYLPFIADCERGLGNLDKAIEICLSEEAKSLRGEVKAEMFLVYAGVLADTAHMDKAIELVHAMGRSRGLPGEYRMRAVQAEQYFLEEAGRSEEALALEDLLDRLEQQYSDEDIDPADIVIDYDLEHLTDAMLEEIGVSEDDASFARVAQAESDEISSKNSDVVEDAHSDVTSEAATPTETDHVESEEEDTPSSGTDEDTQE